MKAAVHHPFDQKIFAAALLLTFALLFFGARGGKGFGGIIAHMFRFLALT